MDVCITWLLAVVVVVLGDSFVERMVAVVVAVVVLGDSLVGRVVVVVVVYIVGTVVGLPRVGSL